MESRPSAVLFEHGVAGSVEPSVITIRGNIESGVLKIVVESPNVSTNKEHRGHGIGLSATRVRLAALHKGQYSLSIEPLPTGAMLVRVSLPASNMPPMSQVKQKYAPRD